MRLLNTNTLSFAEFYYPGMPLYAILSHTWGPEEVTFGEASQESTHSTKTGWLKICAFCEEARRNGFSWAWVDTCCIDKSSSAELSEAINSMHEWYQQAAVCFVYLEDFAANSPNQDFLPRLRYSRWFTRGWTLQELLAPPNVIFYDKDWTDVGSKRNLAFIIATITGIDIRLLSGETEPSGYSIAQKMSWMSGRRCTRVEDIAYSMLGLFNIKMPLLYGEGGKAFLRLQEEIIKTYPHDHSIFAWRGETWRHALDAHGLLASSPVDFLDSSTIVPVLTSNWHESALTGQGLKINLPVHLVGGKFLAELDCHSLANPDKRIAVVLEDSPSAESSYVDFTALSLNENHLRSIRWPMRLVCRRVNPEALTLVDAHLGIEATPLFVSPVWSSSSAGSTSWSPISISTIHHDLKGFSMMNSGLIPAMGNSGGVASYTYGTDKGEPFCIKIQWNGTPSFPTVAINVGTEKFLSDWAVSPVKGNSDDVRLLIDEDSQLSVRAWLRLGARSNSSKGEMLNLDLNVRVDIEDEMTS